MSGQEPHPSSSLGLSCGPHWLPIYFPRNQGQRTHFRGSFLIGCLPHTVEEERQKMLCPYSFLGRMSRPLQVLKHPQFRAVGAFASLPPISQKSEMSSSQRQLKSFCKQLYQGHEKTSRGEENLVATTEVFFWVESPGSGVLSMGGKWVWRGWSESGKTD